VRPELLKNTQGRGSTFDLQPKMPVPQ